MVVQGIKDRSKIGEHMVIEWRWRRYRKGDKNEGMRTSGKRTSERESSRSDEGDLGRLGVARKRKT